MFFHLILLHLSLFLLGFIVVKYKEYKKSLVIFLVILVNIFYAPAFYFSFLGGTAYKVFSNVTYAQYLLFSSLMFFVFSLFLYLKNNYIKFKPFKGDYVEKPNKLVRIYILTVLFVVLGYMFIFIERFPIYHLILKATMVERPDVTGNIPLYYTFSTFIFFILPSFYLYYFKTFNNLTKVVLFIAISFLLISGGNKGVLVYFYLFTWLFILSGKINYKLILMIAASFIAYVSITGGAITSAIRRFFVTQGAALLARFDMINYGFEFNEDIIDKQVFWYLYGYKNGSGPSFFAGDLIINYGIMIGVCFTFLIMLTLVIISKLVDTFFSQSLFILWSFTVILYLVGMGSLDFPTACRIFALVLNVAVIIALEKLPDIKYRKLFKKSR